MNQIGWHKAKLSDAAEEIREKYEPNEMENLPYIGLEHIDQQKLFINSIGSSSNTKSTKRIFENNDILFGSLRPYFRKVVKPKFSGVCSTDITVIRSKKNYYQNFIFYFIANQKFIDLATNYSTGTRMPRAKWKVLSKVEFLFPPYDMQKKVASILSAYDDLIELNHQRINVLERVANAIYKEWFINFNFVGSDDVELIESELGILPKGWKIKKFKDIVSNIKDNTKAGSHLNNLPYVPIDCIPKKSLALNDKKSAKEAKSSLILFKRNDILFGAMRPYFHKVVIAPFDGVTRSTCFVLRPKKEFYLSYSLLTAYKDETIAFANQYSKGSTIPYAVWEESLENMPIIKPPDKILSEFNNLVQPLLKRIALNINYNGILRETRDLLLPKLIDGEIKIDNLEINLLEDKV